MSVLLILWGLDPASFVEQATSHLPAAARGTQPPQRNQFIGVEGTFIVFSLRSYTTSSRRCVHDVYCLEEVGWSTFFSDCVAVHQSRRSVEGRGEKQV